MYTRHKCLDLTLFFTQKAFFSSLSPADCTHVATANLQCEDKGRTLLSGGNNARSGWDLKRFSAVKSAAKGIEQSQLT